MARRPRSARHYEVLELAFRGVSLAVELASMALFLYLSLGFWYSHATNPVAYAGVSTPSLLQMAPAIWHILAVSVPI